ncbi:hypothetical protein ACNOYE_16830 [Nannocystaceae bacterium ST9]
MRCLARLVTVLALAGLPFALHPSEVAAAEGKDKDKDKDKGKDKDKISVPDSAYVKVTLTKGDQKFAHPGFRIAEKEEGVFEIDSGEQLHEINVAINEIDETVFRIHVDYLVDGNSQISEDLVVEHGKQAKLDEGGAALVIDLDPRGKQDKSRKDEDQIDEPPDADDPLSGI